MGLVVGQVGEDVMGLVQTLDPKAKDRSSNTCSTHTVYVTHVAHKLAHTGNNQHSFTQNINRITENVHTCTDSPFDGLTAVDDDLTVRRSWQRQ